MYDSVESARKASVVLNDEMILYVKDQTERLVFYNFDINPACVIICA